MGILKGQSPLSIGVRGAKRPRLVLLSELQEAKRIEVSENKRETLNQLVRFQARLGSEATDSECRSVASRRKVIGGPPGPTLTLSQEVGPFGTFSDPKGPKIVPRGP